ncbi:MAG: glycosyltransferase family 4 protein [Caulobacteraceae bacterium]|nr:glycosyltransferase family 4 protein [Caulobacteraceae bacterium]
MRERRILALFGGAVLFGQERGNIEALVALKQGGGEVLCLVRDEPWAVHIPPALDARGLAWVKVPYIEHRMPGRLAALIFRNPLAFAIANARFLEIARRFRPTHIHAFNPLYVLNFLAALSLVRAPMVYRAGDEPTVHNPVWRLLWRFVLARTDRFVANSKFVARSLVRSGAKPQQIEVIYNLPPARRATGAPALAYDPGRIFYAGQVSEHKGVHVLLDAFRRVAAEFPHASLVIAGRISDWSGDAWGRALREATLADPLIGPRVQFLGETPEVPAWLAHSAVHAAPSLFEDPAPNVVVEAKAAGCPSIVFPRGGMPELVRHGVDGWVCPEASATALAEALRCYLADPAMARRQGAAAREGLKELGRDQFAQRWAEVYAAAARARVRPGQEERGISLPAAP